MSADSWSPERYRQFADERAQPFADLLALLDKAPGCRGVDLGCGTGALTAKAMDQLELASLLGVDSSAAMLTAAAALGAERRAEGCERVPTFVEGDLSADDLGLGDTEPFDVVLSNAALHWVDDHRALVPKLAALVAPGGQLAVQVPANEGHDSQVVLAQVLAREPFTSALGGWIRTSPVLEPEAYALGLRAAGLVDIDVFVRIYLHELPERGALAEWLAGTTLTAYRRRLPADLHDELVHRYRQAVEATLSDERPFPFTFRRVLMTARRP